MREMGFKNGGGESKWVLVYVRFSVVVIHVDLGGWAEHKLQKFVAGASQQAWKSACLDPVLQISPSSKHNIKKCKRDS